MSIHRLGGRSDLSRTRPSNSIHLAAGFWSILKDPVDSKGKGWLLGADPVSGASRRDAQDRPAVLVFKGLPRL